MVINSVGIYGDDEGGETLFIIEGGTRDEILETFAGYSCNCSHDCCGHLFYHPGEIIYEDDDRSYLRQSYGRNI